MMYRRLITEEEAKQQELPGLKALSDFIDQHGGEDLVRHLHAQDVEIVAHTSGALLKCLRTDSTDTDNPESCWRFYTGRFEIDPSELSDSQLHNLTQAPGFTSRDYYYPVNHVLNLTKEKKLGTIDPGTLIVVQATTSEKPGVRMHRDAPHGRMVVAGVKYEVDAQQARSMLASGRPGEIENAAIKNSGKWEGHAQVQKVAKDLETDSIPLFFRGKLTTTDRAVTGIRKSTDEDPTFRELVDGFLAQAGENPTVKDYERFFRQALRKFEDMDIHRIDREGKVEDSSALTKETYKDLVSRLYSRFDTANSEIQHTIGEYGENSVEHRDDYRDLNYLPLWVRDQVGKMVLGVEGADPVSQAIEGLHYLHKEATHDTVMQWIRRHLEEQGLQNTLYRAHMSDPNVPEGRQMGKNSLWDAFMSELGRIIGPRLDEVVGRLR
jgi:hypothetical protein